MKSINKKVINEFIVSKSRFICTLQMVNTKDEALDFINNVKKEHKFATHNCFCFIIEGREKIDDDGEPSGTAALPMLEVLHHYDMVNIVCVVTRYFGGIKLGAGGLIRAYSKAVSLAIAEAEIKDLVNGHEIKIIFPYDQIKIIDYYLQSYEYKIKEKNFLINVEYVLEIGDEAKDDLIELIKSINYKIEIEIGSKITFLK